MSTSRPEPELYSLNLRRIMARLDLTLQQVVNVSRLSERTVKSLLGGRSKPHARTLNRLASALGVPVEEFFWPPADLKTWRSQVTDRELRSKIDEVLESDQRDLLIELLDVLAHRVSLQSRDDSSGQRPRIAVTSPDAASVAADELVVVSP